ncbi:MAG: ABC transporter permease [Faecousia sp.]
MAQPSQRTLRPKSFGRRLVDNLIRYKWLYLFALPGVVYFLVFKYFPIFLGVLISFKNYSPFAGKGLKAIFEAPSAGLYHYQRMFSQPDFYRVLGNTLRISLKKLIVLFPAPILFALLLNEVKSVKFKKVVQTISYLPHFISIVVIAGLVKILLDSQNGPLYALLQSIGVTSSVPFLANPDCFDTILVTMNLWASFGWNSIVYLSALTSIDQGLYEAAEIDGAGKLAQAIHVTIPGIAPTIVVMLILQVGHLLDAGYQDILLLYSELTYSVADVIDTYVYRLGIMEASYGLTAAVGLFKSVVGAILVVGVNKLAQKTDNSLW